MTRRWSSDLLYFTLLFLVLVFSSVDMSTMVGGASEVQQPNDEFRNIAEQIRPQLEEKLNQSQQFPTYELVGVKTQLVAGTNYFMKIHIGGGHFVHARVYQTLPHAGGTLELSKYQENKSQDDELAYF